jgi:Helix-turn-helix domain
MSAMETIVERTAGSPAAMARRNLEDLPELLTYAEAEEFLRFKRSSLQRAIRDGGLDVVYVRPRSPRITRDSIARYLREQRH